MGKSRCQNIYKIALGLRDYHTPPLIWDGDENCRHEWGDFQSLHHPTWKHTQAAGAGGNADSGQFCQVCGAWRGSLGLEPTPELYVQHLVQIFREVRRVLRNDGTLWLNLGDTYANDKKWGGHPSGKHRKALHSMVRPRRYTGLPGKNLLGIPWRTAFALQADGWWLRCDCIWFKPTAMPEPVPDRPSRAHEYLFLFSKRARYYYDADAIREPLKEKTFTTFGSKHHEQGNDALGKVKSANWGKSLEERKPRLTADGEIAGANKRSVWTVASQPYEGAHFACVDEETECLTACGWKRYNELQPGMTAAQFDMSTGCLTWAPIEDIATYQVTDQPMIAAESHDVELLLTPNHRTIVSCRSPDTCKWQPLDTIRADELKPSHAIPVSAEWRYTGETPVTPDWAELLGCYLAEGCETVHSWTVEIYQSKNAHPQKVERIRQLLSAVGAEYTEANASRKWRGQPVSMAAFQMRGFAATYLRQLAPGKQFPDGILCWSDTLLTRLLDGLIDGHRRADGRLSFIQRNKKSADLVQAIGVRLGYSTMISQRSEGTYVVYFTRKRFISFRGTAGEGAEITSKPYTGIVWCPQLPAGTWVARKAGRTFITGNTFPPKLVEPCILAGSSPKACEHCGAPWKRVMVQGPCAPKPLHRHPKKRLEPGQAGNVESGNMGFRASRLSGQELTAWRLLHPALTKGWQPTCSCTGNTGSGKCVILDPFLGSGTVAYVSLQWERAFLGIELNPDYVELAQQRIATVQPNLWVLA